MANLKDVIYLSAEDYNTLYTNGTVTINGTTLTYDANNIYIVPDNTQQQIDDILALIPSGATSSNKLATASDIPTIPTNVSAFNNDAGYLTSHQDISGKADKASITAGTAGTSSATSGSTLAVPYVTMNSQGVVTGYGTHTHTVTGFLTSHQDISGKAPNNHASSATTYGVGTSSNYGHMKLGAANQNGATAANGVCAPNGHTHSQYLTSHQSLSGYATESWVKSVFHVGTLKLNWYNGATSCTYSAKFGDSLTFTKSSSKAVVSGTHYLMFVLINSSGYGTSCTISSQDGSSVTIGGGTPDGNTTLLVIGY